jgi:hypothetical protein
MAEALDLVVVGFLLGIIADANDGIFGSDNKAGFFCGDFKFAIGGGDGADDGLAILQGKMERLRGYDGSDGIPLETDVTRKLGFQQKGFGVGLDDGSGQTVAIFQSHLIGWRTRRANEQKHTHN